jgi:hypothetical protein
MDPRTLARAMAIGRVAFGAAFVLAPRVAASGWIGRDARRDGTKVFITGLGGRDLALGAGLLSALDRGGAKPWLVAALASDAGDLLGTLRSRDGIPALGTVAGTLITASATAAGAWLATQEDW